MKIKDTIYLHAYKQEMRDQFVDICRRHHVTPDKNAIYNSSGACYEVAVEVEWDTIDGQCKILSAKESE